VNLGRLRELAAALSQPATSAEIGARNRQIMLGDNGEAFPDRAEWRMITD
jgi:hypothetical protein